MNILLCQNMVSPGTIFNEKSKILPICHLHGSRIIIVEKHDISYISYQVCLGFFFVTKYYDNL